MPEVKVCPIDGRGKTARVRGCGTSRGEPLRFIHEVVLTHDGDECLIWPFTRGADGRGQIWLDGKSKYASRVVCEKVNGPPPTPKHEAAHNCGNGHLGCVNHRHLRWATHVENEADKLIHGTHSRGERCGASKLTESEVRSIRELSGLLTQRRIAEMFDVSNATVCHILKRNRWEWLS